MPEPRLLRDVSVMTDQGRIVQAPLTSLQGETSPRGDKEFVGNAQLVTVNIVTADTPTAVSVSLDHKPTRAMPASAVKVASGDLAYLACVNEHHGTAWSETQVWFIGTMDGISQQFLVT